MGEHPYALTRGDLVCCPSYGSGLWWVNAYIESADLDEIRKALTPINTNVSEPGKKKPFNFYDYGTWLPKCAFCQQPTVTDKYEIFILQRGMVKILLPDFGI